MELGKPIGLDAQSLIDYFIEGIPDSKSNYKLLLPGENYPGFEEADQGVWEDSFQPVTTRECEPGKAVVVKHGFPESRSKTARSVLSAGTHHIS